MLDRLDALEEKNPAKNKRAGARVSFRKNDVSVRIFHPGGSMSSSVVATRNLSAGGLSFLYPGFLHAGTKVEIILKRRFASDDVIRGSVQHCALVDRRFHQIGVRFEQKIHPKVYLDPTEWGELDEGSTVDRDLLEGTILHLDDQEIERMLVQHFLKGTKIKVVSCATLSEAVEAMKKTNIDCFLCDLLMDNGGGEKAIATFREAGYAGPIALVTAETSSARIKKANDAGASALLTKPFDSGKLIALLAAWLNAGAAGEEPIHTTLATDGELAPLVEQYVARLRTMGRELRRSLDSKDLEGLRRVCQAVKGTAGGFGFGRVAELAREAVHCLDSSTSISDSALQIQQLESACFRAVANRKAA